MNSKIAIAFALGLLACHPQGPRAFGHALERGDALADVGIEDMTTHITGSTVSVWGLLEVPDGSRIQAAFAGVDAIARAELLKLVRVRVAGVMVSVESTEPAHRQAYEHTLEAVAGSLRRAGTTQHGWARVRLETRIVIRVWSRLTVPRSDVMAALTAAHAEGEIALPAGMNRELEAAEREAPPPRP